VPAANDAPDARSDALRAWLLQYEENLMKTNVGKLDRLARAIIGILLIGASLSGTIGLWGLLGVIPLATVALRFCPLYAVLGVNSCDASHGT
jgi:hypothetical protein